MLIKIKRKLFKFSRYKKITFQELEHLKNKIAPNFLLSQPNLLLPNKCFIFQNIIFLYFLFVSLLYCTSVSNILERNLKIIKELVIKILEFILFEIIWIPKYPMVNLFWKKYCQIKKIGFKFLAFLKTNFPKTKALKLKCSPLFVISLLNLQQKNILFYKTALF